MILLLFPTADECRPAPALSVVATRASAHPRHRSAAHCTRSSRAPLCRRRACQDLRQSGYGWAAQTRRTRATRRSTCPTKCPAATYPPRSSATETAGPHQAEVGRALKVARPAVGRPAPPGLPATGTGHRRTGRRQPLGRSQDLGRASQAQRALRAPRDEAQASGTIASDESWSWRLGRLAASSPQVTTASRAASIGGAALPGLRTPAVRTRHAGGDRGDEEVAARTRVASLIDRAAGVAYAAHGDVGCGWRHLVVAPSGNWMTEVGSHRVSAFYDNSYVQRFRCAVDISWLIGQSRADVAHARRSPSVDAAHTRTVLG